MSDRPIPEAGDVRQAWGRVTAWLARHDPGLLAGLGGPGDPAALDAAERRMGVELPPEVRRWLLANDLDAGRRPEAGAGLVALGLDGVVPDGPLLLGLTDIERVHRSMMNTEEMAPSGDPDHPSWRREWLPIAAERDGFHGTFVNTRTGTVGTWSEGSSPEDGEHPSLSAFLQEVADRLEGVSTGDWNGSARARRLAPRPADEPVRRWARANGYLVHDRGRIPAAVREAYEAAR
ncbi:histone-like nucleoid-structuring protein Lsr2 [Kitasatospora sp. NPDC097605]|uniref:Lsr2 family DNA-binding protein n=1 Tax=Kitasatospora sp. NPDC097605 TaxID=3157226 RepID=UPI0033345848